MSSQIRYISDLHFGHRNMALKRGFKNEDEMNEYIIDRWNSVVYKRDITYILGDITMEKHCYYPLLDRLKGFKKVILGNHDKPQHIPVLLQHVVSVAACKYLRNEGYGIILSHIPVHESQLREDRFNINIHGHVHEKTLDDGRYVNVSAEVIDYTPKLLKELIYNGNSRS